MTDNYDWTDLAPFSSSLTRATTLLFWFTLTALIVSFPAAKGSSFLQKNQKHSCRIIQYQPSVWRVKGLVTLWWYVVLNLTLTVSGISEYDRRIKSKVNTQHRISKNKKYILVFKLKTMTITCKFSTMYLSIQHRS